MFPTLKAFLSKLDLSGVIVTHVELVKGLIPIVGLVLERIEDISAIIVALFEEERFGQALVRGGMTEDTSDGGTYEF